MAGSLAHITDDAGNFTMDLIDNLGDAHEALEECFSVIRELAKYDAGEDYQHAISITCRKLGYPDPYADYTGFDDD